MIRAGISEKRAMEISGHKTNSMLKRYDITDVRDIQADGERLARYLEEKARLAEERGSSRRNGRNWKKFGQKFVQRRTKPRFRSSRRSFWSNE